MIYLHTDDNTRAYEYDLAMLKKIKQAEENCVLLNNHNTQPERDQANRRRQIARNKALEARRETAEQIQTIDSELTQITQAKKESKEREKNLREQKKALQEVNGLTRSPQKPNRARGKSCLPDYSDENTPNSLLEKPLADSPSNLQPTPSAATSSKNVQATKPRSNTGSNVKAPAQALSLPEPSTSFQSSPAVIISTAPQLPNANPQRTPQHPLTQSYGYMNPQYPYYPTQPVYYSVHSQAPSVNRQTFGSIDTNSPQFYPGYIYPQTYPSLYYPTGYTTTQRPPNPTGSSGEQ